MTDQTGPDTADTDEPTPESGEERRLPEASAQTGEPETFDSPDQVDWSGWVLVGVVVVSLLVVPVFVLYIPETQWLIGRLGFSQRQAYILFPMLPAILLGLVAVWATLRANSK